MLLARSHQNINQKKDKPKVKTLIALALFAASMVGSLAQEPREWILPNGRHLRAASRGSSPNNTTYDNWSTRGNVNPYTGQLGTRRTMMAFVIIVATVATATAVGRTEEPGGPVWPPVFRRQKPLGATGFSAARKPIVMITTTYPARNNFTVSKLYDGIDYHFRPKTFWETPSDPLAAILRNVKGSNRRSMIQDYYAAGKLDNSAASSLTILSMRIPEEAWAGSTLLMGGEYLELRTARSRDCEDRT